MSEQPRTPEPTTEYVVEVGTDPRTFPHFRYDDGRGYQRALDCAASYGLGADKVYPYDALYTPGLDRAPDTHTVDLALNQAHDALARCASMNIHSHGQMITAGTELDFTLRQLVVALEAKRGEQPHTEAAGTDAHASAAELLAAAADEYATAKAQSEPQLPALSPDLAALAAEADALCEGEDL